MPDAGAGRAHPLDQVQDGPTCTTPRVATRRMATQRAAAMALWILGWSLMLWPGGELGWFACLSPRERAAELERQEQTVALGLLLIGAAALTLWPHLAPRLRWAARAAWTLLCPQLDPEHAWNHLKLSLQRASGQLAKGSKVLARARRLA